MASQYPIMPEDLRRSLDRVSQAMADLRRRQEQMLEPILKAQQEFQRRLNAMLGPMLEAQKQWQQRLDQVAQTSLAAMARYQEDLKRMTEIAAAALARYEEHARKMAEAMWAFVEREAKARGITPEEFMEALRSSAEIMEDVEELMRLQMVVAWNLYRLGEISLVRLFQALPPKYRSLSAERSGVPDDDFTPVVSGITRKEAAATEEDDEEGS